MGEHNSPFFKRGLEDGTRDAAIESACPPGVAAGMDESATWSWMYKKGYDRGYQPVPCACDGSCKKENRTENEMDVA